jgi:hypothetical protein
MITERQVRKSKEHKDEHKDQAEAPRAKRLLGSEPNGAVEAEPEFS